MGSDPDMGLELSLSRYTYSGARLPDSIRSPHFLANLTSLSLRFHRTYFCVKQKYVFFRVVLKTT